MSIIISKSGKNAKKLNKTGVESEDYLQEYIYENPDSLPLDEYKEDLQLLILAREFPTKSGPIDALGVDQDGEVYLIETKLYKNPDKRLVLAQVMDYGASLWKTYSDSQEFISRLQEAVSVRFDMSLREKLEEKFTSGVWDYDEFIDSMKGNVDAGSFRFVVLMDHLEDRLKDLITFMNQNSRFDLFGVELEFYKHEELEIIIPRLFGAEIKKTVGTTSSASKRRKWDEQSFFDDASNHLEPDLLARLHTIYEWSQKQSDEITWGTGSKRGSFTPKFNHVTDKSVYNIFSDGKMWINFPYLQQSEKSIEYGIRLGEELKKEVPSLPVPDNFMGEYVTIPFEQWEPVLDDFIKVLENVLLNDQQA